MLIQRLEDRRHLSADTDVPMLQRNMRIEADGMSIKLTKKGSLIIAGDGRDNFLDIRAESQPGGGVLWTLTGDSKSGRESFVPTALARISPSLVSRVAIDGGAGDDTIELFVTTEMIRRGPTGGSRRVQMPVELRGGDGHDTLRETSSTATLLGGAGDDRIINGPGKDVMDGGPGFDVAEFAYPSTMPVAVLLGDFNLRSDPRVNEIAATRDSPRVNLAGFYGMGPLERDRIAGFEGAMGGDGADLLHSNDAGHLMAGGDGEDTLIGNGGTDSLHGGSGRDWIYAVDHREAVTPLFRPRTPGPQQRIGWDYTPVDADDRLFIDSADEFPSASQIKPQRVKRVAFNG
jgi:Ca2+-binding RTX toxin-like protein